MEQNEYCIWSVFEPLDARKLGTHLNALPGARERIAAGDIEIVPQSQWRVGHGAADLQQLVRGWEAKLDSAVTRGLDGMRVNVNAAWWQDPRLERNLDTSEDAFSRLIANRRVIVLCAYPPAINRTEEIHEAGYSHRFAIARRTGNWQVVETPELRRARADIKRIDADLQRHVTQRTRELAIAEMTESRRLTPLIAPKRPSGCGEQRSHSATSNSGWSGWQSFRRPKGALR